MKYLKTKHQRNSAKITSLIVMILILLCFVVGQTYQDPPEEYGVAINFGNASTGNGNIQPNKPGKSEDLNINKQSQDNQVEPRTSSEATVPETIKENILTQDTERTAAVRKAKELKKAKEKAQVRAEAEAKKKAELDALMGGLNNSNGETNGSEGNDYQTGDKGQLDGNPYASSYFGGNKGNGGVGSGLSGRGKGKFQEVKQQCNESGLVVVRIEVDRNGRVVKAEPGVKGTENTAPCLLDPAKKIAMSGKWPANYKAPTRQIGFVSIDFKLGQ